MVIKGVWLEQIDYIEAVSPACNSVRDAEIIPLSKPSSVIVWLEY